MAEDSSKPKCQMYTRVYKSFHSFSRPTRIPMKRRHFHPIVFALIIPPQFLRGFITSPRFRPEHLSPFITNKRTKSITTAWAKCQFNVGDEVLIQEEECYKSATVEEVRGNGWYTLCLVDDAIRVKRRGSQLQLNPAAGYRIAEESSNLSSSESCEDFEALPNVSIVDLDCILENYSSGIDSDNSLQNLDHETIQQITTLHSKHTNWLLFSDLHVMPSTLSTTLSILNYVHTTALNHKAGIIFLGDFWHHRGYVRIDCLNAVLDAMSKWKVPSIMIPGNHDQIDWRGKEHALTPLKNAYRLAADVNGEVPGPLILSEPTKFLNALFVPHTRDKSTLKAVLSSEEASKCRALFVHADVKGASMNDLIKSQHGLSADYFPAEKCVYSGHFHKPHVVSINNGSAIRYVGSPYQVSLSEAGQSKTLLLVDSKEDWRCVKEIPIDIGPRYHRISSLERFLQCNSEVGSMRSGDKVSMVFPHRDLDEMRMNSTFNVFDAKIKELRDRGVTVQLRNIQSTEPVENNSTNNSITEAEEQLELEDLSPKATLEAYIKNQVAIGAITKSSADKLLNEGYDLLNELNNEVHVARVKDPAVSIELDSVSMVGFGSFKKMAHYPLSKRGVVLLRGTNRDIGSGSNGVGKSTLAMASLWALVGSLDARPVQDAKVSDIVNDFSKVAEVTLRGYLNAKPFVVKRTKNASSGSSLSFTLDGSDLTLQSNSDTQKLIYEHFAPEPQLLIRSIFHGQHSIGSLLESSDAKLKDELSSLISLEIWQMSASLVRSKHREVQRKVSEIDGMLLIRRKDLERALDKQLSAKDEMNRQKATIEQRRNALLEREKAPSDVESSDLDESMSALQTQMSQSNIEITQLEHELYNLTAEDNESVMNLRSQLEKAVSTKAQLENELQFSVRHHDSKRVQLSSLQNQLETFQSETSLKDPNQTLAAAHSVCQTCGQSITSETTMDYIRQSTASKVEVLSSQIQFAHDDVVMAELAQSKAKENLAVISEEVNALRFLKQKEEESLASRSRSLRDELKEARLLQTQQSSKYSELVNQSQKLSQAKIEQSNIQSELRRMNDALSAASNFYNVCCSDVETIENTIAEIEDDKESMTAQMASYGSLIDIFGSKGIQTFILCNIVKALQYYSQSYLDELSDGSLQLVLQVGENNNILKQAKILNNADGTWRTRSLSSLSGGQWRRCSLSLSLGFVDLVSHRGKLRSSLLVLDEPLTHLDSAGRESVGKLLRKMVNESNKKSGVTSQPRLGGLSLSTILVILQDIAAEEIEECFDYIDEVIKSEGESYVVLDQININR